MYGIEQNYDRNAVKSMIANMSVPHFHPRHGVKISHDSDDDGSSVSSSEMECDITMDHLLANLPPRNLFSDKEFQAIDFEKDDDTNFHMDFITAASNSRAMIYDIPLADKHKVC